MGTDEMPDWMTEPSEPVTTEHEYELLPGREEDGRCATCGSGPESEHAGACPHYVEVAELPDGDPVSWPLAGVDPVADGPDAPSNLTELLKAPFETPRERAARRLLAIRALKRLVEAEEKRIKAEEEPAFTRAGQKEPAALPDGTPLGDVRVDRVAGGWKLTDGEAFLAYCQAMRPDQVQETVTYSVFPAYVAAVQQQLEEGRGVTWPMPPDGELVDVPPGWTKTEPGTKLVVTVDKGAAEAVRRSLGNLGPQLGLNSAPAVSE